METSFRAEDSSVSYSVHFGQLCISVLIEIYCNEPFDKCQGMDELIYGYTDKTLSLFMSI